MRKVMVLASLVLLAACGTVKETTKEVPYPVPTTPPPPTTTPPECTDGFTTGFEQVVQVINANCVSCHPGFNSYATMRGKIDESIRRIGLGSNDPRRMPPPPASELQPQEKLLFQKWKADGLPANSECRDGRVTENFHIDADYIRNNIIADLQKQDQAVREQERFLIASHHYNKVLGQYPKSLIEQAVNKTVNSLSRSENIRKLAAIDSKGTVFRVDLQAFGLTKADWKRIADAEPFNIIDNSTGGELIKQLTGAEKPWFHLDNFINIALSPAVYNDLMRVELRADDQYRLLGVDRQAQHDAKTVRYLGFTGSPISNTNRRLRRYDTAINDDGFLWVTNDTDDNDLPEIFESNVFEFPFSLETGGVDIFDYKAEEWIWQLDNGMIGFALYDFPNQIRQELAPVTIVKQPGPFDAEISVGRDCFRCHQILIPGQDQVRQAALQTGDFGAADIERIKDFFQPAGVNEAIFNKDNRSYATALSQLGIDQNSDDPINKVTDEHRSDYDLAAASAFFFLTPEDFQERLRQSRDSRRQIPQLLSNGRVTLDQLIVATPDIIREFQLFVDED